MTTSTSTSTSVARPSPHGVAAARPAPASPPRRAAIPAPGRRLQLERAVGRVLSRPLDRAKPLWELYVFEGLEGHRTAVLLKMHHALADGISGMLIASALFDL